MRGGVNAQWVGSWRSFASKILTIFLWAVKPAFEEFCIPTKKFADVIIPRGAENTVAIDLIGQHIQVHPTIGIEFGRVTSLFIRWLDHVSNGWRRGEN